MRQMQIGSGFQASRCRFSSPPPKFCSSVVSRAGTGSLGGFGAATGATRSRAAGRSRIGDDGNGPARHDERQAFATFRAPRQLDLLRGF